MSCRNLTLRRIRQSKEYKSFFFFFFLLVSHFRLSQWIDDPVVGWLKPFYCHNTLPATATNCRNISNHFPTLHTLTTINEQTKMIHKYSTLLECGFHHEKRPSALGCNRQPIRQHICTGMQDMGYLPKPTEQRTFNTPGHHRHIIVNTFLHNLHFSTKKLTIL